MIRILFKLCNCSNFERNKLLKNSFFFQKSSETRALPETLLSQSVSTTITLEIEKTKSHPKGAQLVVENRILQNDKHWVE